MNALTLLSVVALAACGSGQFLGYPGIYGYPGLQGYQGLLPAHSPVTLKTIPTSPISYNTFAASPLAYNVAPVAHLAQVAPVTPIQTQYHAQDELGQYSFGYAGGPSSRAETRDAFGVVRGSYNYVDSEGEVQTQHYVADALGFRVSATNLPVAPEAPVAAPLALPGPLPEPVEDTPEVAAAKLAHQAAFDEVVAAAAAAPAEAAITARKKRSVVAAPALSAYSPLRFSYGFSSPLTYGRPAAVVGSGLQYTAGVFPSSFGYPHHAPAFTYTAHGAVAPALTYAAHGAVAPALTPFTTAAIPAVVPAATTYAAAAATPRDATLLRVVNHPNHAVSYRVD